MGVVAETEQELECNPRLPFALGLGVQDNGQLPGGLKLHPSPRVSLHVSHWLQGGRRVKRLKS